MQGVRAMRKTTFCDHAFMHLLFSLQFMGSLLRLALYNNVV